MSNISSIIDEQTISSFVKDTWNKECISSIHIHFYPLYGWTSSVEFQNGLTESTQKFKNTDFKALMYEMKIFLETLK